MVAVQLNSDPPWSLCNYTATLHDMRPRFQPAPLMAAWSLYNYTATLQGRCAMLIPSIQGRCLPIQRSIHVAVQVAAIDLATEYSRSLARQPCTSVVLAALYFCMAGVLGELLHDCCTRIKICTADFSRDHLTQVHIT